MSYALSRDAVPLAQEWDWYRAGDWWYAPYWLNDDGSRSKFLGAYYYDHNAHRPPIMVVLPGGCEFCIDSVPSRAVETGGTGWAVTGAPEDGTLTVSPSIKIEIPPAAGKARRIRSYHGFLTAGVITDDLEGNATAHLEWNVRPRPGAKTLADPGAVDT